MNLKNCYNVEDFRKLAKKKLPSPIFNYIDGGSDDEVTLRRNTEAFNKCDLIPNILNDVSNVDLSTKVFGKKIDFPLFLAPASMHRLYHHDGEKASSKAISSTYSSLILLLHKLYCTPTLVTTSFKSLWIFNICLTIKLRIYFKYFFL